MIKIKMGSHEQEAQFVRLHGGEVAGRMYTNFPIKGITKKVYKKPSYRVVSPPATV